MTDVPENVSNAIAELINASPFAGFAILCIIAILIYNHNHNQMKHIKEMNETSLKEIKDAYAIVYKRLKQEGYKFVIIY